MLFGVLLPPAEVAVEQAGPGVAGEAVVVAVLEGGWLAEMAVDADAFNEAPGASAVGLAIDEEAMP